MVNERLLLFVSSLAIAVERFQVKKKTTKKLVPSYPALTAKMLCCFLSPKAVGTDPIGVLAFNSVHRFAGNERD